MVTAASAVCRVCASSATVVDWTPIQGCQGWVVVEHCPVRGVLHPKTWPPGEGRLPGMVKTECQELATRHWGMAAGGREA